jgi:acylphosphatase
VGFRQFVLSEARNLNLNGWVRNDPDDYDQVEVEAEGPQYQLEQLLAKLQRGPFGARVNEVATQWGEANHDFDNFEVRF